MARSKTTDLSSRSTQKNPRRPSHYSRTNTGGVKRLETVRPFFMSVSISLLIFGANFPNRVDNFTVSIILVAIFKNIMA